LTKNVKLQVFVTPEFYLKLAKEAKEYNIKARSDSELIQNLFVFYQNRDIENKTKINSMEDRILGLNSVIQQKEAAIHAYATTRGRKK